MIDAARNCYHGPVGAYISTFIEVAAQAGGEGEEPGAELRGRHGGPKRAVPGRAGAERRSAPAGGATAGAATALAVLRGDGVQVLSTASEAEAQLEPRLWWYLVL